MASPTALKFNCCVKLLAYRSAGDTLNSRCRFARDHHLNATTTLLANGENGLTALLSWKLCSSPAKVKDCSDVG
jgi:hypothetical protein